MQRLYETWKLIAGNVESQPHGYYLQLIDTLPIAADGKLTVLTSLRAWLALQLKHMALGHEHALDDVDLGVDVIFDYAKEIGLPVGSPQPKSNGPQTLVYLTSAVCGACDFDDDETTVVDVELNVINGTTKQKAYTQGGGKPAANNDCEFCDSFVCQSRKSSTGPSTLSAMSINSF